MKTMKAMTYLRALLPIFRIYQLCGYAPFSVPFNPKSNILNLSQEKWKIYNGLLLIFLSILVLVNALFYEFFLEGRTSEMVTYLSYLIACGIRALTVITVIESMMKCQQQIVILQQFYHINDILHEELNIELDYNKIRHNAFLWMGIWITNNIIVFSLFTIVVFDDFDSIRIRLQWIVFSIPLQLVSVKYFQIIQYIKQFEYYFRIINERLEKLYQNQTRLNIQSKIWIKKGSRLIQHSSINAIRDEIVSFRQIYHILWKCSIQFNLLFRWSLLLLVGASFIIIVVNFYRVALWILTPGKKCSLDMISYFIWSLCHAFYFIKLSNVSHNVSQQVSLF